MTIHWKVIINTRFINGKVGRFRHFYIWRRKEYMLKCTFLSGKFQRFRLKLAAKWLYHKSINFRWTRCNMNCGLNAQQLFIYKHLPKDFIIGEYRTFINAMWDFKSMSSWFSCFLFWPFQCFYALKRWQSNGIHVKVLHNGITWSTLGSRETPTKKTLFVSITLTFNTHVNFA